MATLIRAMILLTLIAATAGAPGRRLLAANADLQWEPKP
jgi:hypothetical protein